MKVIYIDVTYQDKDGRAAKAALNYYQIGCKSAIKKAMAAVPNWQAMEVRFMRQDIGESDNGA